MSDELTSRLAQLKQAFEMGILDESTYRFAVEAASAAGMAAQQSGSGSIAQTGGTSAGERGVAVAGSVYGNIYTGPRPADDRQALAIYRRMVVGAARQLPLRGVDIQASDPTSGRKAMDLDQVYVGLDTTTQRPMTPDERKAAKEKQADRDEPEKMVPLSALDALLTRRRMVLLGDPGSGKSTFLSHLGLCLALHGMQPEAGWLERLPGWSAAVKGEDLLPVAVVLRDFARFLPEDRRPKDRRPSATPHLLWNFIVARLGDQNLDFAADPLHSALEAGRAILLLDGLDEIPTQADRTYIRDSLAAFLGRYPGCRAIVTCRTLSYQDPAWQLADLPSFELAPFDEAKIHHFVDAWYAGLARMGEMTQEEADRMAGRLQEAVQRPDLWRLAPNPLLLTVMALVHTHQGRLPDTRALLYEETVDILLWRWEQKKSGVGEEMPRLRRLLLDAGRSDVDLKRVLWRLAFEAHGQGGLVNGESLADIGELPLQKALAGLHPTGSLDWADDLIRAMKLRAGLLLERAPSIFTLPHRTFQEYLAGAHLTTQADFAKQARDLSERWDVWRQVILLAVGRLVYLGGDTAKPLALVSALCPRHGADEPLAWRRTWLAGEVLLEMGLHRVQDEELGQDLLERVQHRLASLLEAGALTPKERAEAGDVLAALGDPRFRVDLWYLPDDPMLGFVEIPAGPFILGEGEEAHELDLPTFYMARYPVTVAQWRAFVEATGHQPWDMDSLRDPDNRPVRWVTWDEAILYCRWLTTALSATPKMPTLLAGLLGRGKEQGDPWTVLLPSEAEWEKAARGGLERLNPRRAYPWGDEADPSRANYAAAEIKTTSAVGAFPAGASPYGVEELSGNVWEWTRSRWGSSYSNPQFTYPYRFDDDREDLDSRDSRVLRGGAYFFGEGTIRASSRSGSYPYGWGSDFGFRVVVVPISHG